VDSSGIRSEGWPSRTKQPVANQLDRDFAANEPNRKWLTDITYLCAAAGWVHLAVVVDLFSRKVVGCCARQRRDGAVLLMAETRVDESRTVR